MDGEKVLGTQLLKVSIAFGFLMVVRPCSYVERGELIDISIKI